MSLPTIDGFAFQSWDKILKLNGSKYALFEQGGVDGYGVAFGAKKTGPQVITAIYRATSESDALSALSSYRADIENTVTIVDQFGTSWPTTLILDVDGEPGLDPLGWIMTSHWTVLLLSV